MRPLCGRFTATLRPLCGHFAVTRRRIRQLARPVSFQKVFVTGRRRRKKKAKKNSKRKQKKKEKRRRRRSRRRPKMDVAGRPGVIELVVEIPFDFSGSFVFLFVCFFHFSLSLSLSFTRGAFPVSLEILTEPHTAVLFRRRSFVFFVCRFARFLLLDVLLFCYFAQSASGSAGLPGPSPSWPSSRPSYGSWNELWANRNERNVKIDTKPKEKNDEEIVRE